MGKTLYLDCSSGISGDMTVAALIGLGADRGRLIQSLGTLPAHGYDVRVRDVEKGGLAACDFDVVLDGEHENHDHDMEYLYGHLDRDGGRAHGASEEGHRDGSHPHGGHGHRHRTLGEVDAIIDGSLMTEGAKDRAHRIFRKLAEGEAAAHGATPETVMLHEVGALDSIVDICAAAVCLDLLDIDRIIVPSLTEGRGTVRCAHGIMPIPVPAVANLCAMNGIELSPSCVQGELVTPTGAAIVSALRTDDSLPDRYRIVGIGLGAGKRAYEGCSGVLRAMLIEASGDGHDGRPGSEPLPIGATNPAERTWAIKLETDIDDCTGEALGHTIELLMGAGAREAHAVPIVMKKGRPACQLQVICDEGDADRLAEIVFENTTTIGMRKTRMDCIRLGREAGSVETPYGAVAVKRVTLPSGVVRSYPEYDSVVAVAGVSGAPFQDVFAAAVAAGAPQAR